MEIELPLAECPQNLDIFGMITCKDVDTGASSSMQFLFENSEAPLAGTTGWRGFDLEA